MAVKGSKVGKGRSSKGSDTVASGTALGSETVAPGYACPHCGRAIDVASGEGDVGLDALAYLSSIIADPKKPDAMRMRAAQTVAQYTHTRTKDGGKKEARREAADVALRGRFAPPDAPKLRAIK